MDTMKHGGATVPACNYGSMLRRALDWIVREDIFAGLPRHGNISWHFSRLVSLAVLWGWSDQGRLTDAFQDARRLSLQLFGESALHSYQGFTEALVRWSDKLLPLLWTRLQALMEQVSEAYWRIGPWLPLAVDGSRFSTPRTRDNEQAFGIKNYGQGGMTKSRHRWKNKRKRSKPLAEPIKPQIWLTLIWHMGLKMPWRWKWGPSTANERDHLRTMVREQAFPENTLFCCDAGFTGYELWSDLLQEGHQLLIRIGSNVHLLRRLAGVRHCQEYVYLWPNKVAQSKQPPLVLRLIILQSQRGTMYLATSVLSRRDLNDNLALQLYQRRWGVELQFRAVKQTFGRRKLRSRTASHALVELDWALMGLWLIQLLAVKEQLQLDSPPGNSSVAGALRVIQTAMRWSNTEVPRGSTLSKQLCRAVKDSYRRSGSKKARYQPDYKDKPCRSGPKIKIATTAQQDAYRKLRRTAA
jgi:hypothetical protein